jgi:hypothetical protein
MIITRKEILRAIRVENLSGTYPISERYNGYTVVWDDKCKVCAVGAVLRQKGIDSQDITLAFWYATGKSNCSKDADENDALKDQNYMAALSIKFEKLYRELGGGNRTKKALAEFVKANFPKQIKVKV